MIVQGLESGPCRLRRYDTSRQCALGQPLDRY